MKILKRFFPCSFFLSKKGILVVLLMLFALNVLRRHFQSKLEEGQTIPVDLELAIARDLAQRDGDENSAQEVLMKEEVEHEGHKGHEDHENGPDMHIKMALAKAIQIEDHGHQKIESDNQRETQAAYTPDVHIKFALANAMFSNHLKDEDLDNLPEELLQQHKRESL